MGSIAVIAGALAQATKRVGFAVTRACLVLVCCVWAETTLAVEDGALPRRMLYLPLSVDPLDGAGSMPIRAELWWLELPDGRNGSVYRLSSWFRVGESHGFQIALDYVGLEGGDEFHHGGGQATGRWTTRFGETGGRGLAVDLAGNLPTGDPALHPLSAQAPRIEFRLRATPLGGSHWRAWIGWWARRVSPPEDDQRDAPRDWFPSGTGVDAALHWYTTRADWELIWGLDLGGLPDTQVVRLRGDLPIARDLALQLGILGGFGPRVERSLDLGWTFGVTWRPSSITDGDEPSSPR